MGVQLPELGTTSVQLSIPEGSTSVHTSDDGGETAAQASAADGSSGAHAVSPGMTGPQTTTPSTRPVAETPTGITVTLMMTASIWLAPVRGQLLSHASLMIAFVLSAVGNWMVNVPEVEVLSEPKSSTTQVGLV